MWGVGIVARGARSFGSGIPFDAACASVIGEQASTREARG